MQSGEAKTEGPKEVHEGGVLIQIPRTVMRFRCPHHIWADKGSSGAGGQAERRHHRDRREGNGH